MNIYNVYHTPIPPFAYAYDDKKLYVKIKIALGKAKGVKIYFKDRYDPNGQYCEKNMVRESSSCNYDYYKVRIELPDNRFQYYFEITDMSGNICYYNERGISDSNDDGRNCFQFPYIGKADEYIQKTWMEGRTVYQIFVDRFKNSGSMEKSNIEQNWGGEVNRECFYGGDLKGIAQSIEYLKNLGIGVIYLTPIFESKSNHKYNIDNYLKIDPNFGDKNDLKDLVRIAHENDIKVILDGVFNHTGTNFFAFRDIVENGENSIYKDWYQVNSFPVNPEKINYTTFATNVADMPKLNMGNPETRKYFTDVAKYWISECDIDGWRLDVCDDVEHMFWRELKKEVECVKRDALLVGEMYHQGKSFLMGDQIDSIMNYTFRELMLDFFVRRSINAAQLNHYLVEYRENYMECISRQLWNLLDSHDTARFLTEVGDKDTYKLATVLQFLWSGTPYVFYGDEVGVKGENDPFCRQCMIWDKEKQDQDLLKHFKRLISIRKSYYPVIEGRYECLFAEHSQMIFSKKKGNINLYVFVNNDNEKEMDISRYAGKYSDIYEEKEYTIDFKSKLDPKQFLILIKTN